jgi:hypothetical protein
VEKNLTLIFGNIQQFSDGAALEPHMFATEQGGRTNLKQMCFSKGVSEMHGQHLGWSQAAW